MLIVRDLLYLLSETWELFHSIVFIFVLICELACTKYCLYVCIDM